MDNQHITCGWKQTPTMWRWVLTGTSTVWVTSTKKFTQKVHIQFPADSWPSRSHVTAAAACCKVVSQYRRQIVFQLQTPPEHLRFILASTDCVAMQQPTFVRTESKEVVKEGPNPIKFKSRVLWVTVVVENMTPVRFRHERAEIWFGGFHFITTLTWVQFCLPCEALIPRWRNALFSR